MPIYWEFRICSFKSPLWDILFQDLPNVLLNSEIFFRLLRRFFVVFYIEHSGNLKKTLVMKIKKQNKILKNVISPVTKAIPDISYQSARKDCKINIFRGICHYHKNLIRFLDLLFSIHRFPIAFCRGFDCVLDPAQR